MGRETLETAKFPKGLYEDLFNFVVAEEPASEELLRYFAKFDRDEDWLRANVAWLDHKYSAELAETIVAHAEEVDTDWDEEFENAAHDRAQQKSWSRF